MAYNQYTLDGLLLDIDKITLTLNDNLILHTLRILYNFVYHILIILVNINVEYIHHN